MEIFLGKSVHKMGAQMRKNNHIQADFTKDLSHWFISDSADTVHEFVSDTGLHILSRWTQLCRKQ